jgi:hypothetical protein
MQKGYKISIKKIEEMFKFSLGIKGTVPQNRKVKSRNLNHSLRPVPVSSTHPKSAGLESDLRLS